MRIKELKRLREELELVMEREHINLCRLYWKAKKHGCSQKLLDEITKERDWVYSNMNYPDRILHPEFEYEHKYAFRIA